jgi:hypothetical protein
MDAQGLIVELAARGIRLIPNPPKLIAVPAAKLTDEDCTVIRRYKADLLALLAAKHEQAEIDRIARLDAERREADRQAGRGYDFDCNAPSHAEYLQRTGRPCVCQTSPAEHEEREIDRLARADGWIAPSPAHALLETCRRYGVALRIDTDGALIVGKTGARADEPTQPWPSLLIAIETHLEAVAALVEEGWSLRADFPQGEVA